MDKEQLQKIKDYIKQEVSYGNHDRKNEIWRFIRDLKGAGLISSNTMGKLHELADTQWELALNQ